MSGLGHLRALPSIDEILRSPAIAELSKSVNRPQLIAWARKATDDCRKRLINGEALDREALLNQISHKVHHLHLLDLGRFSRGVINCSGIILHTNLGRAPLAARTIERIIEAAGYTNVEMNLETGLRNSRGERVTELLSLLTGAEAALVVNNCAAATMMVLQSMAAGREVIVSRSQLVEIGGGFRLPEVFELSGAKLREVGTTNRTYVHDYERAISDQTAAIIRVHRSNFSQAGFVSEPALADLVELGKRHSIPVIDDVGSGCMSVLAPHIPQSADSSSAIQSEPVVTESLALGADVVLFSGDKLFGGPQAGIIVGQQRWISIMKKSPLMRALRVDKLILAALEATTEIHLSSSASDDLPLLQSLHKSPEQVRQDCEAVLRALPQSGSVVVRIEPCVSEIGGGSCPGLELPSFCLALTSSSLTSDDQADPDVLSTQLRRLNPAIVGRIQKNSVQLDLRTVSAAQLPQLIDGLQQIVGLKQVV